MTDSNDARDPPRPDRAPRSPGPAQSATTRLLAIETIGTTGSVAALAGGEVLRERALDPKQRSAQSLAPGIRQLLADVGWRALELEAVAVVVGPGSFTGLRVGVTTAKTLAYAAGAAVIGVGSLEAIAGHAAILDAARLWTVIDAGRAQQFAACFERDAVVEAGELAGDLPGDNPLKAALARLAGWHTLHAPAIVDNEALLRRLQPGDAIAGPGVVKLAAALPVGVLSVEEGAPWPRAGVVGQLGGLMLAAGGASDPFALAPNYLRDSAAEEKWRAKGL